MTNIYDKIHFGGKIVPREQAQLHVASSAVLYGLSVYTVFHVAHHDGQLRAFRLPLHYQRLINSAKIIGLDVTTDNWSYDQFVDSVRELMAANQPDTDCLVRVSWHVDALVPGTRSRGLGATLSMFIYSATPIVPSTGVRLKTSVWRRTPDDSIPSRAKVNGAYINSVLARQDAIDSGYDDCVLLDASGHVTELSAANIFVVRDGALATPGASSDILEGINRRSIIELARDMDIPCVERNIDLTELYIADEAFVCGTSAFVSSVTLVDARDIGGHERPITDRIRDAYFSALRTPDAREWLTVVG